MKFSEVVGEGFYRIQLKGEARTLADRHYEGALHHYHRFKEVDHRSEQALFHWSRHLAHLRHLLDCVYRYGDFSSARDQSLSGMEHRESWNPDHCRLLDPELFEVSGGPDHRFRLGEIHESDQLLKDLCPPTEFLIRTLH